MVWRPQGGGQLVDSAGRPGGAQEGGGDRHHGQRLAGGSLRQGLPLGGSGVHMWSCRNTRLQCCVIHWPSRTPRSICKWFYYSLQNMVSVPQVEYSINPTQAILSEDSSLGEITEGSK